MSACGGDDAGSADPTLPPATTTIRAATAPVPEPTTTVASTTTSPPTSTTAAPTTTPPDISADVAADVKTYAEDGPHPVGVTTLQLPSGPLVEVWYPAVDGTTGTVTYDVRDFTPPAIQELLTGDSDATYTFEAGRDVDVADGRFPVVLFSHGFIGIRVQSTFLTSHLASHGMIVVAPDHPSRDLFNVLGGTAGDQDSDPVAELLGSLDLIVSAGDDADSAFAARVDGDRVAAVGHSAGGGTILGSSSDPRIAGYVSMASRGPAETSEFPDRPSFFVAGATDAVVPPDTRTRPAFEAAPSPTWYWEIEATGHHGFDDFCTFGGGTGIIGLAEQAGLGAFLDTQPQLRTIGEDGCIPPAAPVDQAFPIVRHGVTAWLRWTLGLDPELVGFGPAIADAYDLEVVALER